MRFSRGASADSSSVSSPDEASFARRGFRAAMQVIACGSNRSAGSSLHGYHAAWNGG